MQASLSSLGQFVVDFQSCEAGIDLSQGLERILNNNLSIKDKTLRDKVELMRGLYVDIIGIVCLPQRKLSELIICEVKKHDLTLTDHAQLIGYCIASNTKYGLLISIEGRITAGFESILKKNPSLLNIDRKKITHKFGICKWNPDQEELIFDEIGAFKSTEALCRHIAFSFVEGA